MTEPGIFVFDDLHPEDNAMVQALYSRSPDSVVNHLEKVRDVGSGKFMGSYYIGYGHASIGDCGSTTIFIENVSMLVAKAIQDTPLYSGQEASTRYLNFATQAQYDPYQNPASVKILQTWLDLYNKYMPITVEGLQDKHPFNAATDKNEKAWLKAIEVRAFDIMRSLLPVGTTTLLSWHTNLRQARDHLRHLSSHPLAEVRGVAARIFDQLRQKYPNSFNGEEMQADSERYAERNAYAASQAEDNHYASPNSVTANLTDTQQTAFRNGKMIIDDSKLDAAAINSHSVALDRPRGAPLPRRLMQYGVYNLRFLLDFGSFRDLQRHRNGYCPVPVVTNEFGFYSWYDDELKRLLQAKDYAALREAIDAQFTAIQNLAQQGVSIDPLTDQYLYPMGMAVACILSYSLPQMVYVAELRSGKTVHQSLRPRAQEMGRTLEAHHPALKLYVDYDQDSFTAKRGEQDISAKSVAA